MAIFDAAERLMGTTDATWQRHANPWSVWTRFSVLPLIVLAIWSRVWLGWWALPVIALTCGWAWWNPRAFDPPRQMTGWPSHGVLGEYVFLHHRDRVAAHHIRAAQILGWMSLPGVVWMAWGLWVMDPVAAGVGMVLAVVPKLWFVDRMVWVYHDFRRAGGMVFKGVDDGLDLG